MRKNHDLYSLETFFNYMKKNAKKQAYVSWRILGQDNYDMYCSVGKALRKLGDFVEENEGEDFEIFPFNSNGKFTDGFDALLKINDMPFIFTVHVSG